MWMPRHMTFFQMSTFITERNMQIVQFVFCFQSYSFVTPECSPLTGMVKLAMFNDAMTCSGIYAYIFPNLDILDDLFRSL